jgi:hypothetical protein
MSLPFSIRDSGSAFISQYCLSDEVGGSVTLVPFETGSFFSTLVSCDFLSEVGVGRKFRSCDLMEACTRDGDQSVVDEEKTYQSGALLSDPFGSS